MTIFREPTVQVHPISRGHGGSYTFHEQRHDEQTEQLLDMSGRADVANPEEGWGRIMPETSTSRAVPFMDQVAVIEKSSPGLFDASVAAPPVPMDPIRNLEWQEDEAPKGATVLNHMMGVQLYECDYCGAVVAESEFDAHTCGYDQTEPG